MASDKGILDRTVDKLVSIKDRFSSKDKPVSQPIAIADVQQQARNGLKRPFDNSWQFSARWGIPRGENIIEIREFAQSAWVQMVLNTIKKEISIIDWDLPNKDPEDEQTYDEMKDLVNDYFERMNVNNESLFDVISPVITDVGEIDAGAIVKVFTEDSYTQEVTPIVDDFGQVVDEKEINVLKPLGERELAELRYADGATFLKHKDRFGNLYGYLQYSWKAQASHPVVFYPEEVCYFQMNKRSYETYGYSPVQQVQQVLQVLIESLRWNKDFFENNAVPDALISLLDMDSEQTQNFAKSWQKSFKGKRHKTGFVNTEVDVKLLQMMSKDMEFLEGQKWFMHLVFAVFGVSPVEAGFHENVNQGNQAGQERITVKNAIKPYLTFIETAINRDIIPEILQVRPEDVPFKFQYFPSDHVQEKIEHEQDLAQVQSGIITINEYRTKRGLPKVEWGDVPMQELNASFAPSFGDSGEGMPEERVGDNPNSDRERQDEAVQEQKNGTIPYTKALEAYVEGAHGSK